MGLDPSPASEPALSASILHQNVRIDCADPDLRRVLFANFAAMAATTGSALPDLDYCIKSGRRPAFTLVRNGQTLLHGAYPGELLYMLEKDITVELQKRRSDLFFLHSAALEWQGKACLLAAESGHGKSTTSWALLHHDFGYLTDELSPVDLHSMQVFPYPHALCLKRLPPQPYPLPAEAIDLGRTIHVPERSFPRRAVSGPRPLGAVFLLNYRPDLDAPKLSRIGPSEASAHLYVTALNALAHSNHGLDAVASIARQVPCFSVSSAELRATCMLIRSAVEQAFDGEL